MPNLSVPLPISIICVGSSYTILYRNFNEPTKIIVLVVEGTGWP